MVCFQIILWIAWLSHLHWQEPSCCFYVQKKCTYLPLFVQYHHKKSSLSNLHRSFNVCSKMLKIQSNLQSSSRISKWIHKVGTTIGQNREVFFESVRFRGSLNKLLSIMDSPSHPLQSSFSLKIIKPNWEKKNTSGTHSCCSVKH